MNEIFYIAPVIHIATYAMVVFGLANALYDANLINSGTAIDDEGHANRFAMRAGVGIGLAILLSNFNLWDAIRIAIWEGAVFWVVFDYTLNVLRGKNFFYVGKTSKIDKLFGKSIHLFRVIILIMSWGLLNHL